MNQTMTYDKLYNNMVKKFTVENDHKDYTLGDYMLMKAQAKRNAMTVAKETGIAVHEAKSVSLSVVFSNVMEKLRIKKAPVKDKTIRKFPLRTSFTALCSATLVCALVVCCTVFGLSGAKNSGNDNIVSVQESDSEIEQTVIEETVSADFFEVL